MRPLLEARSRLLQRLCSIAFPQAFAKGDVYELLSHLREFFQQGTAEPLRCCKQDLADFFNPIAKSQFLTAWRITLEFYRQRHGVRPDTVFTINVPTIILHALALQRFMVAGRGFRQAHGSAMGSPLSPVLCGMVIAAQEEIWRRTFSITCSSMSRNLLSLRYVDNRLWISNAGSNNCLVSNCS